MVPTIPPELRCIEAIENSYVVAIKGCPVGGLLRQVETIPAELSAEEVGERLKVLPAALVRFAGGPVPPGRSITIEGEFTVFVVTGQGVKEDQRRRGTAVALGAYQIAQAVLMTLHGRMLPEPVIGNPAAPIDGLTVGAPYATDLRSFWGPGVERLGLTVYGITFGQRITFPPIADADIADFVTFLGQQTDPDADLGAESSPLPDGEFLEEARQTLPTE